MAVSIYLKDPKNGHRAAISEQGELVIAPISYSSAITKTLAVDNQAYNFVKAKAGFRIVITSILIYANKAVGATDATVEIFESNAINSATVSKSILNVEMLKQTTLSLTGLNLVTSEGIFLNAKTDDNSVFVTLGVHYVKSDIDKDLLVT